MRQTAAISATGLLRDFSQVGVLGLADVHIARTMTSLVAQTSPDVALAAALTMRAWRTGSTCLDILQADALGADLDAEVAPDISGLPWPQPAGWLDSLRASSLVGGPDDDQPLCLDGHRLYLRRTFKAQCEVVGHLRERWLAPPPVPPIGATGDPVVDAVLTQWTQVLTGGPGTGKTTAIARVVDALLPVLPNIALAAPTGKAAARLAQALGPGSPQPTTVHRLLGARGPGRGNRYGKDNPLSADIVIVDELSMVSLPLMAALLAALRPGSRLMAVGDPGQLASVEAGAVLADIVEAGVTASAHGDAPLVHHLTHIYRHGGALAHLSAAVAAGDAAAALSIIDGQQDAITLEGQDAAGLTWDRLPSLASTVRDTAAAVQRAAAAGDSDAALAALDAHRLLCAHRQGPYGVATWARQVATLTTPPGRRYDDWWPGRAVLATATTPDLGVISGDQGVAIMTPEGPRLVFDSADGPPRRLPVEALPGLATLDAMTVHKAQGSEFASVTVVLPPAESPLLIRPLLYTAMTRAKQSLRLVGTREQLEKGIATAPHRASGLAQQLGSQLRSNQSP